MTKKSYQQYKQATPIKRLEFFLKTLSKTNRTPEYYVNWKKVRDNAKAYELELNTLNYLIGKADVYTETLALFKKQPELIRAIPTLIACREQRLDVLAMDSFNNMSFYELDFDNIDTNNLRTYVDFLEEAGLLDFLQKGVTRTLVDYVYGVEVGLDSNARKNRSGSVMESILKNHIELVSKKLKLKHQSQATTKFIKESWGVDVPVDKSERNFDEAVFDPASKKTWIIETNYYGGGGSKLKSVAGEFMNLSQLVKSSKDSVDFVWVTDGQGWNTAHVPLLEAFGKIENIFNLDMLNNAFLESLFLNK